MAEDGCEQKGYASNDRNDFQKKILDLSHNDLDGSALEEILSTCEQNECRNKSYIYLHHNRLRFLPTHITLFKNLRLLDLSYNNLNVIPDSILELNNLNTLLLRSNMLDEMSLPKNFGDLLTLEVLNISGNHFKILPPQIFDLRELKSLYVGGNQIEQIPGDIKRLERLEVLYLGGNQLTEIPADVGQLQYLQALVLCENKLRSLPSTISCLRRLRSLALHKNFLTTLPPEIVTLRGLIELSLRDNPLVVRFVKDMTYTPPSLRELAARCIKISKIPYGQYDLPSNLRTFLNSAQRCVNPRCKGVYFDTRVEHIKFVDFCGKYRLPLLEYLCSPLCHTSPAFTYSSSDPESSDEESTVPASKLKRVLLG